MYSREGILQFHGIQLSDAGKYRCTAVNSAGQADAVAEVGVAEGGLNPQHTLFVRDDEDLFSDVRRPTVLAENKDQTGSIGSTVTLHCRVNGVSGQPEVNWFREHKQLPVQSRVNGEYLQIYNLQPEDSGRYFCEIATPEGSASDYINLNIDASK